MMMGANQEMTKGRTTFLPLGIHPMPFRLLRATRTPRRGTNIMIAMTHSVFINRRNLRASIDAIHKAGENIRKGHSMVIFPEGTRSKTGEIASFKHGAVRMATESGACVVPVTVKGLRDSFEDRKHIFQRRDCYMHVGEPVKAPSADSRTEVADFISKIEGEVRQKYAEL